MKVLKGMENRSMKVIVQDILKMANAFGFIGFNFILRTLNGDAHGLVKLCFDLEKTLFEQEFFYIGYLGLVLVCIGLFVSMKFPLLQKIKMKNSHAPIKQRVMIK